MIQSLMFKSYLRGAMWIATLALMGCASFRAEPPEESLNHDLLPITPLEIVPTINLFTGEPTTLDLGRFYVVEECEFRFEAPDTLHLEVLDLDRGLVQLSTDGPSALATLRVTSRRRGGNEEAVTDIPITIQERMYHEFRFEPDGEVSSLAVAGSFNGWSQDINPMTDEDGDGVYTARVAVEPGRHMYKFVLNGNWMADPGNPDQSDDGYANSILVVDGDSSKTHPFILRREMALNHQAEPPRILFAIEDDEDSFRSQFQVFFDGELRHTVAGDRDAALLVPDASDPQMLAIPIPADDGASEIRILGINGAGDLYPEVLVLLEGGRPVSCTNLSDSWRGAVLYYAFVDRFSNGDATNDNPIVGVEELSDRANWNGGDLQGLLDRIEEGYFDDLGVTCLWLSPMNRQPEGAEVEYSPPNRTYSGYHGYWPVSSDEVDPHFGDEELLRRVVDTAHEHGIRIILDCVANHVHEDHPLFTQHRDWFGNVELPDGTMNIKQFDAHRLTTWFDTFLPSFDYTGAPEAMEHMTDNAIWWLQTFNLDGFRHDATKHIPDEFWLMLTRKIRLQVERPRGQHTYQVGETISGRSLIQHYAAGGMLDGQFDFALYWPTRDALAIRRPPLSDLAQALQDSLAYYGPSPIHSALLGNHDVSRFMAYADGDLDGIMDTDAERTYGFENDVHVDDPANWDRMGVAFAYLLTIPHVPMIYYGDEVGLTGAQDPDNRRMMQFEGLTEEQRNLRTLVSRLCRIRGDHPALWQGDYLNLAAEEETWLYARINFDEVIFVALNRADEPQEIEVSLPAILGIAPGATLTDLLTDETIEVGEGRQLSISLAPRSARLLHLPR